MADVKKGPDLVAVALANTMSLYLPAEIDAVNAAWNDPNTVPALPYPKKIFSERRLEVPESPTLMIAVAKAKQTANGAYSSQTGWASMTYPFDVMLIFRGDKLHILERMGRRYAQAIWEVLMKHQELDGSLPGPQGLDPLEWAADTNQQDQMTLQHVLIWNGLVYVEQSV